MLTQRGDWAVATLLHDVLRFGLDGEDALRALQAGLERLNDEHIESLDHHVREPLLAALVEAGLFPSPECARADWEQLYPRRNAQGFTPSWLREAHELFGDP